jgi:hypothetical protein
MRLPDDQIKDRNYLSMSPHAWSYEFDLVDPSSLNAWLEEDGRLFHSRYESKNILTKACQEFDFPCSNVMSRQDGVVEHIFWIELCISF